MQLRGNQKAGWITEKLEPLNVAADPASLCGSRSSTRRRPQTFLRWLHRGLQPGPATGRGGHRVGSSPWSHSTCPTTGAVRSPPIPGIGDSVGDLEVIDGGDPGRPGRDESR